MYDRRDYIYINRIRHHRHKHIKIDLCCKESKVMSENYL